MPPIRHNDDRYLDAARESILAVGWRRTTLTDVARRAGVARMSVYRRWPDMQTLLADLLFREWGRVVDGLPPGAPLPTALATGAAALRDEPLFRRVLDVDPELLLPYLLDRRGRSQERLLEQLAAALTAGQATGEVRSGDPAVMARALLLGLQGFVVSARTMDDVPADGLDRELEELVERYLRP
jgi:AcrR family transcriptional regulator